MSDSLRDRIVAAIAKADQDWCSDNPVHEDMADAVIAALGLEPERRVGPGEPGEGLNSFIRYATRWEVDW